MSNNNNGNYQPEVEHAKKLALMRKQYPNLVEPSEGKEIQVKTKLDEYKIQVLNFAKKLMQEHGVRGFTSVINSTSKTVNGVKTNVKTLETVPNELRFIAPVILVGSNGMKTRGYRFGVMDIYFNPKLKNSFEYFPETENDPNIIAMDKIPDDQLPEIKVDYAINQVSK